MTYDSKRKKEEKVATFVCKVCGKREILECCKEGKNCCGQPMEKER